MSVSDDSEKLLPNSNDTETQNEKLNTMTNNRNCTTSDAIILGIWAAVAAAVYAVLWLAQRVLEDEGGDDYWLTDLTLNLLGYSTVFLPGYVVIRSEVNLCINKLQGERKS